MLLIDTNSLQINGVRIWGCFYVEIFLRFLCNGLIFVPSKNTHCPEVYNFLKWHRKRHQLKNIKPVNSALYFMLTVKYFHCNLLFVRFQTRIISLKILHFTVHALMVNKWSKYLSYRMQKKNREPNFEQFCPGIVYNYIIVQSVL